MSNNKLTIAAITTSLSAARMSTYEAATTPESIDDPAAVILYAWNAKVSGALLLPLHVCEVVIRNAVSDALEAVYGSQWPWSATFECSLPNPNQGYSPRRDLQNARNAGTTTGKVIPELKFVFWQKMFTSRYDNRIWDSNLLSTFPSLNVVLGIPTLRQSIYQDLEQIRKLRNRIAHHEPIFTRNLMNDYSTIRTLVSYRCKHTAAWLDTIQQATSAIAEKP